MYGLIGKKLGHSFSKPIHEKLSGCKYNLIELSELDYFFKERNFRGINVTIPYKNEVIKYLDELSTEAKELNSVNTIINDGGKLKGYNTDYIGLEKALNKSNISVSNKTILILGNGSTSRTIQALCSKNLAKKTIVSARNPKENEYHISDVDNFKSVEIIFNATPVGMFPNNNDELLIDLSRLPNLISVIDLVYNPLRSNLIIEAEKRGLNTLNGLSMLINQAVGAQELFHKKSISNELVTNIYNNLYLNTVNIVFIGMPMSGKTHFTRLISKSLEKEFIDIDQVIEKEAGISIPEIFKKYGETHFRNLENIHVEKVSKLHNQAVSCGGGIILNEQNMQLLKHNGIIVFLDVSLELLYKCNPKGRPLLKNKDNLRNLYNQRIALYRQYADITINKKTFDSEVTQKEIEVKINEYISTKWT